MILLVVWHNGDSVAVDVGLLVALPQHFPQFTQLVVLQLLRTAFFNDSQLLEEDDSVGIIGDFKAVGNLDDGASWIVLLQELDYGPSSNEGRGIFDDYYLWLADEDSKDCDLLAKACAQILIYLLDVCIQSFFLEVFEVFCHSKLFCKSLHLLLVEVGHSPAEIGFQRA
jgi:hypothetical protein